MNGAPQGSPDWGVRLAVPGAGARVQSNLDALGRRFVERFDAQFAGRAAEAHDLLAAARFVRGAVAELCWSGPVLRRPLRRLDRPMAFGAPRGLTALPPGVAHDCARGEVRFANGRALARFLGALVRRSREDQFLNLLESSAEDVEIPSRLGELRPLWSADPRRRPLLELVVSLAADCPPGVVPILFGSLAGPPPWPAYADVDLALYLGEEAFESGPELLRYIERFRRQMTRIFAVDPIHHHAPYILTAADLRAYPRSILPLQALRLATTLSGAPLRLSFAPLAEDRLFALEALVDAWRGVRGLAGHAPRSFQDRYTAKFFSSLVLLAPALFCGCLGRPVDKAASFELFKHGLGMDAASVETIEAFERFRLEWRWTLSPPRGLMRLAGVRAAWLARSWNRFPCARSAARLAALAPRVDPLFEAMVARLVEREGLEIHE